MPIILHAPFFCDTSGKRSFLFYSFFNERKYCKEILNCLDHQVPVICSPTQITPLTITNNNVKLNWCCVFILCLLQRVPQFEVRLLTNINQRESQTLTNIKPDLTAPNSTLVTKYWLSLVGLFLKMINFSIPTNIILPSVFASRMFCLWPWSRMFITVIFHININVQFFHLCECSVFVPSYNLHNISVGKLLSNSNYVFGWLLHRIGMVERMWEGLWVLLRGGLFALCLWHLNCFDIGDWCREVGGQAMVTSVVGQVE